MVNKETGLSRGFGFVSYESKADADLAIQQMNGFRLGSKRLKVQHKRGMGNNFDFEQEFLFAQELSSSIFNPQSINAQLPISPPPGMGISNILGSHSTYPPYGFGLDKQKNKDEIFKRWG